MGKLTRTFLWIVLAAFVCGAALGIFGIFAARSRDTGKYVGVMMSVLLFGLTGLGTAVVFEKARWRGAMLASFMVSAAGLLVFVVAIYVEPSGDAVWKMMLVIGETAAILPYVGLISLTRLTGWRAVVKWGTVVMAIVTAVYAAVMAIAEPSYSLTSRYALYEILAMLLILTALMTVVTPVMHWISGTKVSELPESTKLELEVKCPRCEVVQTILAGRSACRECGLKFELKVEEPRCECGYLLFKLQSPVCPECGRAVEGLLAPAAGRGEREGIAKGA